MKTKTITSGRRPRLADLVTEPISEFGQRVKVLLSAYGWEQKDLAELLAVRPQSVSEALRTKIPTLRMVERMAAALKVEPKRLDPSYPRRKAEELRRQRIIAARAKRREDAIR